MSKVITGLRQFNRGLISPLALARTDIERTGLSAETMTNWIPRNLGSMMLRPGTSYIGATLTNQAAKFLPFIFSTTDTALCEFTDTTMRVWVNDALVTRPSVSSAVTNGGFDTDLTGWTDKDEAGATTAWNGGGYLAIIGTGTLFGAREQEVTVAAGDQGVEHALDIVIERGPVTLRVGSTTGDDDYINETVLGEGSHSLTLTPTGNFFIRFLHRGKDTVRVDSCNVASSGVMTVTAPWAEADLSKIRFDQSGDILYIAADGYQQYKVERRSTTSWSVVKYEPQDGPFNTINTTNTTLTASGLFGTQTLTSSTDLFKSSHVGSLWKLTSDGQKVTSSISAGDNFTNTIKVTGTLTSRVFTITRAGTWSGTVTLQRSLTSDTGPWEDVTTYTTNGTVSFDDALDNQIAWYRIGVKSGGFTATSITNATQANPCQITAASHDLVTGETATITGVGGMTELNGNTYTVTLVDANNVTLNGEDSTGYGAYTSGGTITSAGSVSLTLDYPLGSIDGIGKVTSVTNSKVVLVEVLQDFGSTDATKGWYEGAWSTKNGFPTAVSLFEGRLAWAGRDKVRASVSDAYESFDDEVVGDSGPITRTIGSGPVDNINWLVEGRRLIVGADGSEMTLRTSSDDEILTPTNANLKPFSTQGSAGVGGVRLDSSAIYVQRGGQRIMEASYGNFEYESSDLTTFYPEAGDSPITHIAIQRQPDTRIHCVRADGTVTILLHDKAEDISCWVKRTGGTVEDIVMLPGATGDGEDAVYYLVNRTINGSTVRYLEKWALESQCQGGTVNRQVDSHVVGTVTGGVMTGLTHLEGETVAAWVNGKDVGTYTVSSGQITGVTEDGSSCVGIAYTAQFKSSKLAYASRMSTALAEKKSVKTLAVILRNAHFQGLQYGRDFNNLDNLPKVKDGTTTADDTVYSEFDEESFSFPGVWDTDSRLCLQAASPRPCTLLAAIIGVETNDRY